MDVKRRIYSIEYDEFESKGGSFKYSPNPEVQNKKEFFDRKERDRFIERFLYLKSKDMIFDNVRCFVCTEIKNITEKEMENLINTI